MNAAVWLNEAEKWVGLKEVPGPGVNARIRALWYDLPGGSWFWKQYGSDDSKLPWCGAACAGVFKACGIALPKNYASARAWLEWGTVVNEPTVGAVVVFGRKGGAHVAIIAGKDARGRLMCYGGNQGDAFTLAAFDLTTREVLGYRYPPGFPLPALQTLPLIASNATASTNEA
jgi:uncharacterized protein (TIGR02594 family)